MEPKQPTCVHADLVAILAQSNRLRALSEVVPNVDIVYLGSVCVNAQGTGRVVGPRSGGWNRGDQINLVRRVVTWVCRIAKKLCMR